MRMFCPECRGALVTADGVTATCTVHGGDYRILFARLEEEFGAARMRSPPAQAAPMQTAPVQALSVAAPVAVQAEPAPPPLPLQDDFEEIPLAPAPPPVTVYAPAIAVQPQTVMCAAHKSMPAVAYCRKCGIPSCSTCDFCFPGDLHLCPNCATNPSTGLSGGRKSMLIASYVMVAWTTLATAGLLTGMFTPHNRADAQAFGIMILIFVLLPSVLGAMFAFGSLEKRLGNPPGVWISVILNSLILGFYALRMILFTVIGGGR